jgi:hypothetical protein
MKTLVMFLLMTMTAHAEPLYLKCTGEKFIVTSPRRGPAAISVIIDSDGLNVRIEGEDWLLIPLLPPNLLPPKHDEADEIIHFSKPDKLGRESHPFGRINRITGQIYVHYGGGNVFEGVCHKTEKLF